MSDSTGAGRGDLPTRRRIEGAEAIHEAFEGNHDIALLLCREGELSSSARAVIERAGERDVPLLVESEREMRRMSGGETSPELIALESSGPRASRGPEAAEDASLGRGTLDDIMSADGLVLILVGLRYPANVGFILRSAEVAGAAGIVLSTDWGRSQLDEALRVGMRADRFLPLVESNAADALAAARRAGRRIVALETSGDRAPWEIDLTRPTAMVVGGEALGIPDDWLASADDVVRLPTRGFIPSYNVQAAVGMLLGEWLRQTLR